MMKKQEERRRTYKISKDGYKNNDNNNDSNTSCNLSTGSQSPKV